MSPYSICAGIPTLNESECITNTLDTVKSWLKNTQAERIRILLVDNNSSDNTVELAKQWGEENESRIEIIEASENYGYSESLYTILLNSDEDYTIIIPADMQFSTEDWDEALNKCLYSNAELVVAVRGETFEKGPWKIARKLFYTMLKYANDKDTTIKGYSGLGVYSARSRHLIKTRYRFGYDFRLAASNISLRRVEHKYTEKKRIGGSTNYGVRKAFKLAYEIIRGEKSIMSRLAFLLSAFSIALAVNAIGITAFAANTGIANLALMGTGLLISSIYILLLAVTARQSVIRSECKESVKVDWKKRDDYLIYMKENV
jgi:glycosyltransferase involved in cell wall biosynthesis